MNKLAINDLYACLQGEGCLAGTAMVLVRLHGCDVGCPFCDTKESWRINPEMRRATLDEAIGTNPRWCEADAATIAAFARERFPGPKWALVTGGEPAAQELGPLVRALHDVGYKVAIETSGTARGHLGVGFDWVCVSPKFDMPGGLAVHPDVLRGADEIKMVIGRPADLDRLDAALANLDLKPTVQICLQPVSQSEKMTRFCAETAIGRGLRLSLQTHKFINIR